MRPLPALIVLTVLLAVAGCGIAAAPVPSPTTRPLVEHDGYRLRCVQVPDDDCLARADAIASAHEARNGTIETSRITIRRAGYRYCWVRKATPLLALARLLPQVEPSGCGNHHGDPPAP